MLLLCIGWWVCDIQEIRNNGRPVIIQDILHFIASWQLLKDLSKLADFPVLRLCSWGCTSLKWGSVDGSSCTSLAEVALLVAPRINLMHQWRPFTAHFSNKCIPCLIHYPAHVISASFWFWDVDASFWMDFFNLLWMPMEYFSYAP